MKNRLKDDLDKIKLDEDLKEDTLKKMKRVLNNKNQGVKIMTRKKFLIPALSILIVGVIVFGFIGSNLNKENGPINVNIANAEDLMKDIQGEDIEIANSLPEDFLDKTRDLSIKMFKELSSEENALYSPTPLYLALGLVANGAEGETKDEILNLLKDQDISQDQLNLYYKTLIEDLTSKSDGLEVDIVNSIWYHNEFNVYEEYLNKNKTYYGANAYKLDFRSDQAPTTMNEWVKEVSRGKIEKMIEEIGEDVVMYLFSSIYFNGKWENPFSKGASYEKEFRLEDGSTVNVDFMNKKSNYKFFEDENQQGVLLPYKEGKYGFLALLPNEATNIRDYISSLDKDSIKDKINKMTLDDVSLSMPKFEIEYGKSITDELKALGLNKMFDEQKAELYKMGAADGNLYVSDVAQKTYLRVDEEGTEAASIVKVEISAESLGMMMDLNRPFVYSIVDLENNLPIFIGVLDNPGR